MGATASPGCARARAATAISIDGYRIDHLVGLIAPTCGRATRRSKRSSRPRSRTAQLRARRRRCSRVFREPGAEIIAEDLGIVPDFVRDSLARLGVPGFRVFRWERHWHDDGSRSSIRGISRRMSVATSGTHDTEPPPCGGTSCRPRIAARGAGACPHRCAPPGSSSSTPQASGRARRGPLEATALAFYSACTLTRCSRPRSPADSAVWSSLPLQDIFGLVLLHQHTRNGRRHQLGLVDPVAVDTPRWTPASHWSAPRPCSPGRAMRNDEELQMLRVQIED